MTHPLSMKAAAERNPQEEPTPRPQAKPMHRMDRRDAYKGQTGTGELTPAQWRRYNKKNGHNGYLPGLTAE